MMGLTTRTKKSASKQAIAVLIKRCFMFTGFLIPLQNFIVNQIHFITFGGGYIWYLGGKVTGR